MIKDMQVKQDELMVFAQESLGLAPPVGGELTALSGRGSDRAYFRFQWQPDQSAILVRYESSRIENTYFADIAQFLFEQDIPVPRIIRHDAVNGLILMEDLESLDLWTIRASSWETRRELYRKTIVVVHRLHSIPARQVPADRVRLMEPFSPALYRWERDYFKNNFVKAFCNIALEPNDAEQLESELASLAERLQAGPSSLVHRDLQSQNVMVFHESPYLIDFQGMRLGSPFYDLGSLLCDPYVTFSDSERMELLLFCHELSRARSDWGSFQNAFWEASAQRLMQALGAYGFLGLTKGLTSYLEHIPAGLRNLTMAAENAQSLPALLQLCKRCDNKIRDSRFEI